MENIYKMTETNSFADIAFCQNCKHFSKGMCGDRNKNVSPSSTCAFFELDQNKLDGKQVENDFDISLFKEGLNYLSEEYPIEKIRALSRSMMQEKGMLAFFISGDEQYKGKVVNEIFPYKQTFDLVYFVKDSKKEVNDLIYFNETFDKRKYQILETVDSEFWFYQFESNHRMFILISEERLELEHSTIYGNKYDLKDFTPIGVTKKIGVGLPIILVQKARPTKSQFKNHEELKLCLDSLDIDENKYFNFLFTKEKSKFSWRHPKYFEWFMSAFLLSAKHDDFPLHLLIVAKQGTGKSFLEECIFNKFEEEDIVEGGNSTFKALIPSFKGSLPQPGALLSANRVCIVDEFLRILMRTKPEDRFDQLSSMNALLEHKKRRAGSGNTSLLMNCTAKLIAVSNAVWGTNTMPNLLEQIDGSFLSRLMVWYQDKEHIEYVQSKKGKQEKLFDIDRFKWIGIYDYMQSFVVKYDKEKIKEVYTKGLSWLGEDLESNPLTKVRDCYTARYSHHILLLLDGIVKTRCLLERDMKFEAKEIDYEMLASLWYLMVVQFDVVFGVITQQEIMGKIKEVWLK